MRIRTEKPDDIPGIYQVNIDVFRTDAEANLVDMLREEKVPLISLVAEDDKGLVGHILFTPVVLMDKKAKISIAGLGPMAVKKESQRKGIGYQLMEQGFKQCLAAGYGAVVVLGHPDYYSRFGFVPSLTFDISSLYEVPDDLFMIKELKKGILKGIKGTVTYHPLFNEV